MVIDHDILMLRATTEAGRVRGDIPTALLTGTCLRSLVGTARPVIGAVLQPPDVLASLDDFVPQDRETREEYGALLKLALIAEAYGLVLVCGGDDPTRWAPDQDVLFDHVDVQAALGVVARQLGCTADQAAHRLWAHAEATGPGLLDVCADIRAGRLAFVGTHDEARATSRVLEQAPREH